MLSRRKDRVGGRDSLNKTAEDKNSGPVTTQARKSSDSKEKLTQSTSSLSSAVSSKGLKRRTLDDPHDQEGSEYLRRKHNFIKSTILTDYQPDICKDYKETGFCGFGDSCKFLHDRSDYKHGWQLEQEWAKGQHKDEADDAYLIKDSDDEDQERRDAEDTKVNCVICKEPYKDPVMVKCKHQFCEKCAEKECIDKCFVCDKPTSSIFKPVKARKT